MNRGIDEPLPDIVWLTPDGSAMTPDDWDAGFGRALGVFLNGAGIRCRDARGTQIVDQNFLVYFNAHDESIDFCLPTEEYAMRWEVVIDTSGSAPASASAGETLTVDAKTLVTLRQSGISASGASG